VRQVKSKGETIRKCVIGAAAQLLISTAACAAGEKRIAVALTVPDDHLADHH